MPYSHLLVAVSIPGGNYILCKRCGRRWTADAAGIDAASTSECADAEGAAGRWLSA